MNEDELILMGYEMKCLLTATEKLYINNKLGMIAIWNIPKKEIVCKWAREE